MANVQPINWVQNATVNIDVSNTSQRVALGGSGNGYRQINIMNDGTETVWIAFGDSTVSTAATTGKPIGPGADLVATVPNGVTYVAAIAAAATGKIYFTPCSGI